MLMSGSTMRPPFGSRASASNTRSTSAGSRTAARIRATEKEGAAASTGRRNRSAYGALCGLKTGATRVTCGAVCLSASSHLVPIENSKLVKPVRLPPGCARFGTSPWPTGSVTCVNTIGTAPLCSRSAVVTGVLLAKIKSGAMASSSAAWSRNTLPSPAQRYSIERLRPLTHPSSRKPFSNATTRDCASGSLATRPISTPIRPICLVCARAASGHAAPTPPRSMMKSRRFVCRKSSILRGDGGSVMTVSPSRPEARRRFGSQTANELGAPVASSIPEQLRGREPALARKGYEDALVLRNRRVEGSSGRDGVARRVLLFGAERPSRLGDIGGAAARLLDHSDRHRGYRRLRAWCRALVASSRHARAPSQSFQAAAVRQGERSSGQERSARRPNDRLVRRHHADASSAADDAGSGAARRDARCSPPAQR